MWSRGDRPKETIRYADFSIKIQTHILFPSLFHQSHGELSSQVWASYENKPKYQEVFSALQDQGNSP